MAFSFNKFIGVLIITVSALLPVRSGLASETAYQASSASIMLAARRGGVSLDDAVRRVQEQTGGRVLKARQKGGVYIIKVLMPSGVVRKFRIQAN